ncbi:S-layer homology domain-containing protein [Fenollaria massiliensis]|uniref:S-layer homology domain-containing protein n=1 Tax=Fenollaria massiliensis TaxID=938288 RepID=A0A9E7DJC3_9FIRM|nr:S-layer homology domain-containing protein [Fenollaria massiliensis]UQK58986.1 S-layer homology domain-containing protein [Fenollaria massiliensis]
MDNYKRNYLRRTLSLVLAVIMIITLVPLGVFAQGAPGTQTTPDALSSATYYNKANWENKIKDKSRWPVGDDQRLVRVTTSEPVQMNDIDYDGNFVDANGRTVLRMVYKEKGSAATGVWYRARFNFGELDQYIDYDKSYMVGLSVAGNEKGTYPLTPVNDRKDREVDLGQARGDLTNQRKNLPINLVLKEGVTIDTLGKQNYIVQMRLTDTKGERIYAYAPKGTSMDYSTYTKTTSVSLEDKVNRLFIKGGYQKDGNNATAQEFVMSEFIANPEQYKDEKNLGIIRTQYTGQTNTIVRETVGDQPIAFTQVFDAKLLDYMKEDDAGNVAYVNVLENSRLKSKFSHNFGIKKKDFNKSADGKLAYLVIGTHDFQKDGVNKVEIPQHDQYSMISGFYITAIDYVVDKSKFEDTFAGKTAGIDATRKLNYSMISGWTNPNKDGWAIYERTYDSGYVANEGESFIIDTTTDPADGQIMLQIGNEDAVIRKQQGYYSYYITGNKGIETIEKYADGIFKFDLREGATVKSGDKIKVYMPYAKDHDKPVNFLEIHNGTKLNEGGATLKLQKDRNINMHLYKEGKKGYYILKYTLADGTKAEKKFEPKGFWSFDNKDKVMDGGSNLVTLSTGGNFYINTKKLKPGEDIIVESYDEKGTKLEDQTSWFKYRELTKAQDTVKELTWTDHSDKSSILSINKSLYTPYQVLFTNDYADGTDDFYKDPKVLPASNDDFKKDTKEFVGYTKYDGGKVRTLYEEGKTGKLYAKVEADENEYDKDGNLVGKDVSKKITIPKSDIFDAQFAGDSKEYTAYEYKVDLTKMLPYHSDDKTETKLTLLKDMKFVSTASDGSSLPSDLLETRVRARVLFDANTGKLADGKDKVVKIAPDNINFFDQKDYKPNGFEGANVKKDTGDKFPEAPTLEGKNFLGWVTEDGKKALGDKAVVTADEFNKLPKDQIFTNETPITRHLVVYAVYSDEVTVTFDANQGRFGDGKDTTNLKVENGSVTKPTDPTRDGFTFKGWADTKDAKEANVKDFTNITSPKTVYAVWERTDKTPLTLNDPEKTVVIDKTSLTEKEQEAVEAAVIKANPDLKLTKEDVVVDDDGTVTVNKDGKTGTITPDKTVEQKEVKNEFNPPKEPVKVVDKTKLTPDEKQAVKDAVKAANPDRNLKDDEITVGDDGKVTINQNGKTGEIPADKTVVQNDSILKLEAPDKTEVKDVTNLTKEERDKVAAAVKQKNNLADGDKVEVDSKGNVTVTTADGKTGTLEGKDTVKPFDRAGKTLNDPAITPVSDLKKLTDYEKQKVRDAVKAANPDLGFKDEEIQVADDGTVTVPMGTDGKKTIEPAKTVKKAEDTDKIIKLVAPEKTLVADKTNLTQEEKGKVEEAVKKANPTLPEGATIKVANDGSVTVTQGTGENQKVGQLSQTDTVIENIKAPTPVEVKDPSKLTDEEKGKVEQAVKDANPNLPADAKVTVGNDGTVTVTDKDGKEIGKLTPEQTVKKAEKTTADKTDPAVPAKTKVANKDKLTDDEKAAVKKAIEDANKDKFPEGTTVTVGDDGTATITYPDKSTDTIKGSDLTEEKTDAEKTTADKTDPAVPAKTKVANKDKLTDDEKAAVKKAIEDANKDKFPEGTTVTVGDDGTATITYPDKSTDTIKGSDLTEEKTDAEKTTADKTDPAVPAKTKVANKDKLTDDEKAAVKKAIEDANKDKFPEGTTVTVGDDGTATITYPDKSTDTIKGSDLTEEKTDAEKTTADKTDPAVPAKTKVANKDKLTDDEKAAVKKAIEDANKDKFPEGTTVTVGDDGTATITYPDKSTDTIKGSDLTEEKTDAEKTTADKTDPAVPAKTKVANKDKLTDDEKAAVKKAIEDANKDKFPEGTTVTVGDDGTATITYPDKSTDTIKGSDLTEEKTDAEKTTADKTDPAVPAKTKVANKDKLTDDEKAAVKKAIEDANKDKFPEGTTVTVGDDGTATITYPDKSTDTIKGSDLTEEKGKTGAVVAPAEPVEVKDPSNLTDEEKGKVEEAVKKANPDLPADAKVTVGNDGSVTVTDANGKTIGTLTPAQTTKKAGAPTPSYDDIIYPDTDIYVGDNVNIYPLGNYGNDIDPYGLTAPRGVRVKANPDGSINVEVSPDYRGPSEFYIDGYAYVNGNLVRISIKIRVIDDAYARYRYESRRFRPDRRDRRDVRVEEPEKKVEEVDTREIHIHKAYIYGYTDGTVRPNGFITRAEAAAMLSRLLEDENTASALKPAFSDTPSKWYNKAINAVVARGIMRGYSDGTFRPNAPITRAEFAQMISAIDAKPFGTAPFADVKGHWAELAIGKEYAAGRISGYPNGTFRPDAPITRAEAAHILNKIFERNYDLVSALQSNDKGNIKFFTDLSTSFWGYNDMVEATNTHTFRRRVKGMVQEDWSEINRISH